MDVPSPKGPNKSIRSTRVSIRVVCAPLAFVHNSSMTPAPQGKLFTMKTFIAILASSCFAVAAASKLRVDLSNTEHVERQLQDLIEVVWIVDVTLEDGASMDPDTTMCTKFGRSVPFYTFVKDVATDAATAYLQKSFKLSSRTNYEEIWTLEDVVRYEDIWDDRDLLESDQEDRSLPALPGFSFKIIGLCRPGMCSPDNGDGRRLGSSKQMKQSLTSKVSNSILKAMKSKCGIGDVLEVSFNLKP